MWVRSAASRYEGGGTSLVDLYIYKYILLKVEISKRQECKRLRFLVEGERGREMLRAIRECVYSQEFPILTD